VESSTKNNEGDLSIASPERGVPLAA